MELEAQLKKFVKQEHIVKPERVHVLLAHLGPLIVHEEHHHQVQEKLVLHFLLQESILIHSILHT